MTRFRFIVCGLVGVLAGCRAEPPPASRQRTPDPRPRVSAEKPAPEASAPPSPVSRPDSRHPAAPRIVAIGDVHGDLEAARSALRLAGAIDENDRWIGGDLVVVQTGDQLDRGDDEPEILRLFETLQDQAAKAGGKFLPLNGNHEIMNVAGDFRYVTPEGARDFSDVKGAGAESAGQVDPPLRDRAAAFLPGGPWARKLAGRNVVVVVGDTVFVHGGVLPEHVAYGIDKLNEQVSDWMAGRAADPRAVVARIMSPDSPVWTRLYSASDDPRACQVLDDALRRLSATRMVVGHTVQRDGITSACDDKVWRIDVGMAEHYGGDVEVLEITPQGVSALRPEPS